MSTSLRSRRVRPQLLSFGVVATALVGFGGSAAVGTAVATTPAPQVVSSVTPAEGRASGGDRVEATGVELVGGIFFGERRAGEMSGSATTRILVVPPGEPGTTVPVSAEGQVLEPQASFTYAPVTTAALSLSPSNGVPAGGTRVTISSPSIDFEGVTDVRFGPQAAETVERTAGSITVTAPAGVNGSRVPVSFATAQGDVAGRPTDLYAYGLPDVPLLPVVSRLSPNSGVAGFGGLTTISGARLAGATSVRFGTKAAAFFQVGGRIIAIAPPLAKGTVPVTVTTKAGTSAVAAGGQYTYRPLF